MLSLVIQILNVGKISKTWSVFCLVFCCLLFAWNFVLISVITEQGGREMIGLIVIWLKNVSTPITLLWFLLELQMKTRQKKLLLGMTEKKNSPELTKAREVTARAAVKRLELSVTMVALMAPPTWNYKDMILLSWNFMSFWREILIHPTFIINKH